MRSAATRTDAFAMTTKTAVRMEVRAEGEMAELMSAESCVNSEGFASCALCSVQTLASG